MGIDGSGASRAGGDGIHNEDAFRVDEGLGLYVVCDGVSDSAAGEVAARIASEAVAESVRKSEQELDVRRRRIARFVVEKAMKHAMRALDEAEASDSAIAGLETTITLLLAHRDLGIIGHRGDSRAYLIRRDRCHQLTIDHEFTESVDGTHPGEFDVFAVELRPGDIIVLCTDGAEDVVEEDEIVRAAADVSPWLLASRIVSAAQHVDPSRDATAVVVRVSGERDLGWFELSRPPLGTAYGHTLEYV